MVRKDKIKLVFDLHLPVTLGRCRVGVSAVNRSIVVVFSQWYHTQTLKYIYNILLYVLSIINKFNIRSWVTRLLFSLGTLIYFS